MIRVAVKGVKKVKVLKPRLRVARVNGRILERDVVKAINIGLKHPPQMGAQRRWAQHAPIRCGRSWRTHTKAQPH